MVMASHMASIMAKLWPSISRRARKIKSEGLTYLSVTKIARVERELKRIRKSRVSGQYLEFGVALGGSAILIAHAAVKAEQRFVGFDVFGMIPPPKSPKDDQRSRERYAVIQSGQSCGIAGARYYGYIPDLLNRVVENFERHNVNVDDDRVTLVQGLFEDTWPLQPKCPIAFVHIDCDWYDPVRYCLEAVATQLQRGGSIILDDYHDYGGCRAATDEFLAARSDFERVEGDNVILRRLR